jgi:exonuclease SbcD
VRFLLFADLHLDAPFQWAGRELARARRQALRETLKRICVVAHEQQVDAILSAGDLYENERFSADTAEFLRATFAEVDLPVYLAPGNHDWFGAGSLYRQVKWSPNVHLFTTNRLTPVELSDGVTLWGAGHLAPANTGGFLDEFRVDRGGLNLALFHGSEVGELAFQGSDKAPHAPFHTARIPEAGLAHAFVGHYHSPRDAAWHTYPGNPDPLSFGETGDRGAVLVDVAADGGVTRTRIAVGVSEVHDVDVDLSGVTHSDQVLDRVRAATSGLGGIARVTLAGELAADVDVRVADVANLAGAVKLVPRLGRISRAYDFDAIATEPTVRGRFVADVLAADLDDESQRRVLITGLRAFDGRATDLEVI